ncbi:MAG TPA: hypothetical protein VHO90_04535 [Bacteroidales bacterium]|nr:hypothetical protein [Bacteroidales bacterium]
MSNEYIISLALIIFISNNCVAQDLASVLTRHNQVTGYSVLEKVVTVCIEGEIEMNIMNQIYIDNYKTSIKRPGSLFTESEFMGRKLWSRFDGSKFVSNTGRQDTLYKSIDVIKYRLETDFGCIYSYYLTNQIQSITKDTLFNKTYFKITAITSDNYILIFYLNTISYLVEDILIPLSDPKTGNTYTNEIRYSDFKNIEGIVIPFKEENYYNGKLNQIKRKKKVKLNCNVNNALFVESQEVN